MMIELERKTDKNSTNGVGHVTEIPVDVRRNRYEPTILYNDADTWNPCTIFDHSLATFLQQPPSLSLHLCHISRKKNKLSPIVV